MNDYHPKNKHAWNRNVALAGNNASEKGLFCAGFIETENFLRLKNCDKPTQPKHFIIRRQGLHYTLVSLIKLRLQQVTRYFINIILQFTSRKFDNSSECECTLSNRSQYKNFEITLYRQQYLMPSKDLQVLAQERKRSN